MSSSNFVDFSVRQNKSIERLIVFDNLRRLIDGTALSKPVYVGLGSVWFSDFLLAHRELSIDTMISIESDPVIFERAKFNRPYRTLEVIQGSSADVIPLLLKRPKLIDRPWIVWLDYDKCLDEDRRDEIAGLLNRLPENSTLLITCNAQPHRYEPKLANRVERLKDLFGDAVEDGLQNADVKSEDVFMKTLCAILERFVISTVLKGVRSGGYVPAFNLAYQDGTPMITVGGFLPSPANANVVAKLIGSKQWTGKVDRPIATPPLTSKEVGILQAQLPRNRKLTRKQIQRLGFDLEDSQIESFVDHYLKFPSFVQVAR